MEGTLEMSHKEVKDIKDDSLSLEDVVLKETKDNTRKDEKLMTDLEKGDMENFKHVLDINIRHGMKECGGYINFSLWKWIQLLDRSIP